MIRIASLSDLDRIEEIYNEIHTEIESGRAVIGWIRGVYPTREAAENSIRLREMYVMEQAGEIVACGRINRYQGPEYNDAGWSFEANPDEVLVLHTLVVSPKYKGQGYGTEFALFYENMARREGFKALRIDTNALNRPARAMYKKLGYTQSCIIPTSFNGIEGVNLVCLDKKVTGMDVSAILEKMIAFSEGNLHDIAHFLKVHAWARLIAEGERLDAETKEITEIAAIVHDIACPLCRKKYGSAIHKKQEEEGEPLTREFLKDTGLMPAAIDRIAYLVGHHHTLTDVEGMDYRILLEADYLVNADESSFSRENMENFVARVFRTETGKRLMKEIYGV